MRERGVLLGLQALVLVLPLMLGGRPPWTLAFALPIVLALLGATILERRRRPGPRAPALWALAGFVALALATTVPVPPAVLGVVAPATARLYTEMLPGWPQSGGWSVWRPVAIEPYGVWYELSRIAVGTGVFAVLVSYPWSGQEGEDPRHAVFGRMLLTLVGGGVLVAAVGLQAAMTGTGQAPWVNDGAFSGRISGPFVNPNHFAAWLEMIIPVALAYAVALVLRVRRRLTTAAETGQGLGVRWRQAWAAALISHQRRLCIPLVALAAAAIMGIAHRASGSRGGTAALLTGVGVTAAGLVTRPLRRRWPWLPGALALALVLVSGALLLRVAAAEIDRTDVEAIDESLGSRLVASVQGIALVRDHLLLGTGLGSWLHAFRRYQAPPIDDATWDHAHDDYVELGAETGLAGLALAALFGITVLAAGAGGERTVRARTERTPWLEEHEWRSALHEHGCLRWGLIGGVAAILIHSLVDFSLRMPANLLTLMVLLALLVLSGRREPNAAAPQLGVLAFLITVAAAPVAASGLLAFAGATPLSPEAKLQRADLFLAERRDAPRADVMALVRAVIDAAPVYREAHELLASALGPGLEGDASLRRAIALEPSAVELRDELVARLWARGDRVAAAAELEEAVMQAPYLDAHASLVATEPQTDAEALHVLLEGDSRAVRVANLAPEMAGAMERALRRTLASAGVDRLDVIEELVSLHEARGQWEDAANLLRAEGERSADRAVDLARAARNYLRAGKADAADSMLVAALLRTPEDGRLYRKLAVDVYAKRGDFESAERVLRAAERNATDMMPVYEGVTQVLAKQQSWLASKAVPTSPTDDLQETP